MSKPLLLIFVRAPKLGKVKSRLAQTIGPENALQVYQELLQTTRAAATPIQATKWVCYADEIMEQDLWAEADFEKHLQPSLPDLGHRMHTLFAKGLVEGYSPVVIIGSDCPGLTAAHLEEAFQKLTQTDLVLGPAKDGGYYLLGLNYLVPDLFANIPWSTENVLTSTVAVAEELELVVSYLPVLADVDEEADLAAWPHLQALVKVQ
ncbi:TIGR04282 family arsenosugar biosynthesis glycosyltransferase [Rufibacter glacialis]|nr:TIGR04282 family arsenosugar biosynthesis glycosyltransferase [Rufibacter glacialis]GGK79732.1 hypothetical protein GCM10011405_29390 [Rufibacter glacialis]